MMDNLDATAIWKKYQAGEEYLTTIGYYQMVNEAYHFFEGDQWHGVVTDGRKLPCINFITPVATNKYNTVIMQAMTGTYRPFRFLRDGRSEKYCQLISQHVWKLMERNLIWDKVFETVYHASICGSHFMYFYGGKECRVQLVDTTNVYFADEQERDLQKQEYILIWERRNVDDVVEEARRFGIPESQLSYITRDDDLNHTVGVDAGEEVRTEHGKCASVMMLYRNADGFVCVQKSVRNLIYHPEEMLGVKDADGNITGMTKYPLVHFTWGRKAGRCRGVGEVSALIDNQKEVNYILVRRSMAVKKSAFPVKVVSEDIINHELADNPDVTLKIKKNQVDDVRKMVGFISPAGISPDAKALMDDIIRYSQDFASAGEAALGMINPENASGAAINAAVAQSNIPLNAVFQSYKIFIMKMYMVIFDILKAYSGNGLELLVEGASDYDVEATIPAEALRELEVFVSMDVTSNHPYNKIGREATLREWRNAGYITFEEYADNLEDDSIAPKSAAEKILEKRKTASATVQMPETAEQVVNGDALQTMQSGNAFDEGGIAALTSGVPV